ncbi:replication endonuclease [Roseateles aquae]|uniref:replication endonuclease n=1 Tax=Roseateles aquae TaxID=3077235 RepID=UPI003313024C
MAELQARLLHCALQDSGDESGAIEHGCDFKLIEMSKGSATAYIAKYVSKNIDGEYVGDDLEGKSAVESAKRVEAWCANWGIRQFQAIGCPPVGVWRELRRIPSLPKDAPEHLQRAHRAANKQFQHDGDERETVAWDDYCRAQGGMGIGREACIKLAKRAPDGLGRYGDAMQPRPYGIETVGTATLEQGQPLRTWLVESVWHVWSIERPKVRRFDWRSQIAETAQPASPWTRVNNCTKGDAAEPLSISGPPKFKPYADQDQATCRMHSAAGEFP